ncbi:HAD family hydrolase [Alicyclobacillus mengziensis]|uniref:HAD family hydrolase n=1 Tax=Alicyclobacillus mengziensis TaxID=2931921 RepID=A0A9X7W0S7_9BACL|nr:HAD family hydrolase [Alicyclobacillus mengziensis]QSO48090.1 HAD family hydrolase [Alicyclobacillus mengziensis]
MTTKTYNVSELLDCRLFVLDLDGTVYEETNHFSYYGDKLARHLSADVQERYLKDVADALAGQHTLHYGDAYDVVHKAIVRNNTLLDWEGNPLTNPPGERIEFVDDPWNVYGNIAVYYGASAEDIHAAFAATRAYMESPDFPMQGMPGLRDSIHRLKSKGVHFALATNSPEPDSRTILGKLGLTGAFEMEVFNAKKQVNAPVHFRRFQESFNVPFEQMVSVGDHFRNEIRPAIELGMKTICIDRYHQPERSGVTVIVHRPSELAAVFNLVADLRP